MTLITTTAIQPFAIYDGDPVTNSTIAAGANNTVFLVGVRIPVPVTMTGVRMRLVTADAGAGHYDVGIYDATGTNNAPGSLKAHCASSSTALSTGSTNGVVFSPTFIGGNLSLQAGLYWLALWTDNTTDTFTARSGQTNMSMTMSGTVAGPLPASASSITGLANTGNRPSLVGLLANNWT